MENDEYSGSHWFFIIIVIMSGLLAGFSCLVWASNIIEEFITEDMTETEKQEYYSSLNNTILSTNINYKNVTILDKKFNNGILEDDYDVVYKDLKTNTVYKLNDMQVYYTVEIGKSYNIRLEAWNNSVVCEI